jgi:hypothetical protein
VNRRGFLQSVAAAAVVAPVAAKAVEESFTPTWTEVFYGGARGGGKTEMVKAMRGTYYIPRSPYEFAVGDLLVIDERGTFRRASTDREAFEAAAIFIGNDRVVTL